MFCETIDDHEIQPRPRPDTGIGRIIGNYHLIERVGEGGMAMVYRGVHSVLGHEVAVKLLHERHMSNTTMVLRFINEARAVAGIRHPGIVMFHEIGRTTDGQLYTVMEYLRGQSLWQQLKNGPLGEARTLCIARQVAAALAVAHAHQVLHRDVKPGNIFLAEDAEMPGGERIKVLDFGIAKVLARKTTVITKAGRVVGTPAYMAPEQCVPNRVVDGRTDIYGLGVLMYRMVTGIHPFAGHNEKEILRNQCHAPLVLPTRRGARISQDFEDVIATCLAKDPAERFSSMNDLAARLSELEEEANMCELEETMPLCTDDMETARWPLCTPEDGPDAGSSHTAGEGDSGEPRAHVHSAPARELPLQAEMSQLVPVERIPATALRRLDRTELVHRGGARRAAAYIVWSLIGGAFVATAIAAYLLA